MSATVPVSLDIPLEIAVDAMPDDDRVWVPQSPGVFFRPLFLNTITGQWCNLLKVTKTGVVSRHRHPGIVVGYVLEGEWKYDEHDWVARKGGFVYEPPGEIHTLRVPEHCTGEMITFFNVTGALVYLDDQDRQVGYEDVFTKLEMCRRHYEQNGLGADYVEQFRR